ncbi:hypothetical protein [Nonomuraea sp. NPDC049646]|uniref:hypothetical protein n=1 Tax=unclassified Nonomuraea TaxID=2593643 RepID=UPI00379831E2
MTGRLSRSQVLDQAVFALELAAGTATPDTALAAIRNALGDLDAADVRRVAACLAWNAVRAMPPADVQRWIQQLSLEHLLSLEGGDGRAARPE